MIAPEAGTKAGIDATAPAPVTGTGIQHPRPHAAPPPKSGKTPGGASPAGQPGGGTQTGLLPVGAKLGQFRVIGVLGRGGAGTVYEAEDELLERRVAVKVLPSFGRMDETARAKFLHEARAACKLDHPNVVGIYQVGEFAGTPYIAMQLVRGGSSADFVRRHGPMDPRDATRVVIETARALSAAHALGIVHRDIKPANIMLGAAWSVKVADFGLAKLADEQPDDLIMGTPSYMAPEQWTGRPADARSDLYSLGATYFALLAGRPPFRVDEHDKTAELGRRAMTETAPDIRTLRPEIPAEVAAVVAKSCAKNPADRYQTADAFLADLQAITFETPADPGGTGLEAWAELAAAQGAALSAGFASGHAGNGHGHGHGHGTGGRLSIKGSGKHSLAGMSGVRSAGPGAEDARRTAASKRLNRLRNAARNPWLAPGLLAGAVLFGVVGAVLLAKSGGRGNGDPAGKPDDAKVSGTNPGGKPGDPSSDPPGGPEPGTTDPGGTEDPDAVPPDEVYRPEPVLTAVVDPVVAEYGRLSAAAWQAGRSPDRRRLDDALAALNAFARKHRASPEARLRELAETALSEVERLGQEPDHRTPSARWEAHDDPISALAMTADGKSVVSGCREGRVRFWSPTGTPRGEVSPRIGGIVGLASLPDGSVVAAGRFGRLAIISPPTETRRPVGRDYIPLEMSRLRHMTVCPDGKWIALVGDTVRVMNWPDRTYVKASFLEPAGNESAAPGAAPAKGEPGPGPAPSPKPADPKSPDPRNAKIPAPPVPVPESALSAGAVFIRAPTGQWCLAVARPDRQVFVHELPSGKVLGRWEAHAGTLSTVVAADDGRSLATGSTRGGIRVWAADTGAEKREFPRGTLPVVALAMSGDGERLAASDTDAGLRLFSVRSGRQVDRLVDGSDDTVCAVFGPDDRLFTGDEVGRIRAWDASVPPEPHRLDGKTAPPHETAASPDGRLVAAILPERVVRIWSPADRKVVLDWKQTLPEREKGAARPTPSDTLPALMGPLMAMTFTPDSSQLTLVGWRAAANLDVRTGKLVELVRMERDSHRCAAWSSDGKRFAVGGRAGIVRVWTTAPQRRDPAITLYAHRGVVRGLAFSPDGTRLWTAGEDGVVRCWDVSKPVAPLPAVPVPVPPAPKPAPGAPPAKPVPPSKESAAKDAAAKEAALKDLPIHPKPLSEWTGHTGAINDLAMTRDGALLATASQDGTVRLWDAANGANPFTFNRHAGPVLSADFSADGRRLATAGVDHTLRVWDLRSFRQVDVFGAVEAPVVQAHFTEGGNGLVAAYSEGAVFWWPVSRVEPKSPPAKPPAPGEPRTK